MNYIKEFSKSWRAEHFATSLLASLTLGHITADKREIKDFPKLPSATSFIRKTLGEITAVKLRRMGT